MVAAFATLMWVYASLPEQVVIQEDGSGRIEASRELVFYVLTGLLLVVNVLVYLVRKLLPADIEFRAWFHGLIVTINIFMIFAMNVIQTYNSSERFDFSRITFILYGAVGLVILWAISWPIYRLFKKS